MLNQPLPRDVRRAIDLLVGDLGRSWRIGELAQSCGASRRTLEKHFRHFLGCTPLTFLRDARLDQARRHLLRAPPDASVTAIASACGMTHLGRFARAYSERFGETPSQTLRLRRTISAGNPTPPRLWGATQRPTLSLVAVEPDRSPPGFAGDLLEAISGATLHRGWTRIVDGPTGRYHLRARIGGTAPGPPRIGLTLVDRANNRVIWADIQDGPADASPAIVEYAERVAGAIQTVMRDSEIAVARAAGDPATLSAWQLAMRALPSVLSSDPTTQAEAIECLDRAIDAAPHDPLPRALAAWCRALRAGHRFVDNSRAERVAAVCLADQAAQRSAGDPLASVMLSAAYALAHDLAAAERHARNALAVDGGSAWAWGRLAWVHAYRGDRARAIECCRIARALGSPDPLSFLWAVAIAAVDLEHGDFAGAAAWYSRALAEEPRAIWLYRFLAPAHLHAGDRDAAHHSFALHRRAFPDLTISEFRTGLPNTPRLLDRVAEGLASLGMRLS
jgi:AraC-like DNA-binding protein